MPDKMYRKVIAITIVLFVVGLLGSLFVGLLGGLVLGMGEKPSKPSQTIIDFTLQDLNNNSHKLSEYKGKVVFLNFWATWCPPCREEMPSMQKLYESWDKNRFVMLAVNLQQSREEVSEFTRKNQYTFPILLDSDGRVGRKYGIRGIPTTLLINEEGRVVDKIVGSRIWKLEEINNIFK